MAKKGTIYGDRWQLIESLDGGGQAEVFLVRDLRDPAAEPRALKRIRNGQRGGRFANEVRACTSLDHPGIIRLLDHSALDKDASSNDEKMFLVMPVMADGNLEKRKDLYKGSIDTTLTVAAALAAALEHAHDRGVIHRDVKPRNILFNGQNHEPVLTDFGISLVRGLERQTEDREAVGPRDFMAPELEGGGQLNVTPAADLYSLGKVIYYMLSGGVVLPRELQHDPRFEIFSGRGMRHQLLGHLVDRLVCPLDQRIATASEVLRQIKQIQAWEQKNTAILLPETDELLAGFVARQRKAISIGKRNDEVRKEWLARFERYRESAEAWIRDELEKFCAGLMSTGLISAHFLGADITQWAISHAKPITIGNIVYHPKALLGVAVTNPLLPSGEHRLFVTIYAEARIEMLTSIADAKEIELGDQKILLVPSYFLNEQLNGFMMWENRFPEAARLTREFRVHQSNFVNSSVYAWPKDLTLYEGSLHRAFDVLLYEMDQVAKGKHIEITFDDS